MPLFRKIGRFRKFWAKNEFSTFCQNCNKTLGGTPTPFKLPYLTQIHVKKAKLKYIWTKIRLRRAIGLVFVTISSHCLLFSNCKKIFISKQIPSHSILFGLFWPVVRCGFSNFLWGRRGKVIHFFSIMRPSFLPSQPFR